MNKKHLIIGTFALATLLVAGSVYAENGLGDGTGAPTSNPNDTTLGGVPPKPTPMPPVPAPGTLPPKPLPPKPRLLRADIKDTRQQGLDDIRNTRAENRDDIEKAREDASNLPPDERKAEMQNIKDKIQENRDEMKAKREDLKSTLKEKREELKNELHLKMRVRFDALVERLNKITGRVQSRIDELKTAGTDVTKAQSDLDTAKASIADLTTKAAAVVIVQGTDQATLDANKATLDAIKVLAEKAKKDLLIATYDLKQMK